MINIQEWFTIKSGVWWRSYGRPNSLTGSSSTAVFDNETASNSITIENLKFMTIRLTARLFIQQFLYLILSTHCDFFSSKSKCNYCCAPCIFCTEVNSLCTGKKGFDLKPLLATKEKICQYFYWTNSHDFGPIFLHITSVPKKNPVPSSNTLLRLVFFFSERTLQTTVKGFLEGFLKGFLV